MKIKNCLAVSIAMTSMSTYAITETSPWKNQFQEHSMWCWNASVVNLMYAEGLRDGAPKQCDVANFAFSTNTACTDDASFYSRDAINHGNWLSKPSQKNNDNERILSHYGFPNTYVISGPPSFSDIQSSINRNHGILTDWHWKSGGGHIVLVNGYDVQKNGSQWVEIFNPWPGEGEQWKTYDSYIGGENPAYNHTTYQGLAVK
jgi:hypothetical protein